MSLTSLQERMNQITEETLDLWREHETAGTLEAVPHLTKAFTGLALANRPYDDGGALDYLMKRLNTDGVPEALGKAGYANPEVVTALLAALRDGDRFVRDNVAKALGASGRATEAVITALVAALNDEYSWVRVEVAAVLGKSGMATDAVVTALLDALNDEDEWVRGEAAESLGKSGRATEEVITALLAALKDEDWQICGSGVGGIRQGNGGSHHRPPCRFEG